MEKENLNTIALLGFLLLLIIATLYIKKQQELVAVRPDYNAVIAKTLLGFTGQASTEAQLTESCPAGCVAAEKEEKPSKKQKDLWKADPVPRVSEVIDKKFSKNLDNKEIEQANFIDDQLWWRSENDYRILVPQAKVLGLQVPTTKKAEELAPDKKNQNHPASNHPLLKKVIRTINKEMSSLGYKRSKINHCPINEAYDPFNNCLYAYTNGEQKCILMGGYGRLDRQESDKPYLRLELACSDQYELARAQQEPFLYTLQIINPEWQVPDMAVYSIKTVDDWSRVSFGSNYGIFQKISSGYRLLAGGLKAPTCELVRAENIPESIYQNCL